MDEGEDDEIMEGDSEIVEEVNSEKEDCTASEKEHPTDGWETDFDEDWDLVDPTLSETHLPPPEQRVSCLAVHCA